MQQQVDPCVQSTVRDRMQQQAYESTTIGNGCGSSSSKASFRQTINARDGSVRTTSSRQDAAASVAQRPIMPFESRMQQQAWPRVGLISQTLKKMQQLPNIVVVVVVYNVIEWRENNRYTWKRDNESSAMLATTKARHRTQYRVGK